MIVAGQTGDLEQFFIEYLLTDIGSFYDRYGTLYMKDSVKVGCKFEVINILRCFGCLSPYVSFSKKVFC